MLMMEESEVLYHGPLARGAAFAAAIGLYYEAKISALPSPPIAHW